MCLHFTRFFSYIGKERNQPFPRPIFATNDHITAFFFSIPDFSEVPAMDKNTLYRPGDSLTLLEKKHGIEGIKLHRDFARIVKDPELHGA